VKVSDDNFKGKDSDILYGAVAMHTALRTEVNLLYTKPNGK